MQREPNLQWWDESMHITKIAWMTIATTSILFVIFSGLQRHPQPMSCYMPSVTVEIDGVAMHETYGSTGYGLWL